MDRARRLTEAGLHLTAIAAMDLNGVIGADKGMPWHLPDDLRWFKNQTRGKPVLMGRKTRETLDRALPGRRNIVLTRQDALVFDDCAIAHDLDTAIECVDPATDGHELMILGGSEVYAMTLPWTSRLLITRIEAEYDGDTWFPAIDWSQWARVDEQITPADARGPRCRFQIFDRCTA